MKVIDIGHPLEQVLHRHAAAPEAQALLARVASEKHLSAQQLALFSRPDVDPQAKELRRARQHLLLCETCNPAWLGAELRKAESPNPPFVPAPPAWAWPKFVAFAVVLLLVGWLLHLVWPYTWQRKEREDLISEAFEGHSGELTSRQKALQTLLKGIDVMAREGSIGMKAASTLCWHHFGGRSVGQLAEDHEVSETTIELQLAEGRARLERILKQEFGVDDLSNLE